jgi:DNA-binding transcriptional LysR family regulator
VRRPVRRIANARALEGLDWVMPWQHSTTRRLIERCLADIGLEPRVALEAGGWEIVKRYVALGLGVAVIPEFCLEPADRRRLFACTVGHLFGRDRYGLAVRRGITLSAAARAFVGEVDAEIAKRLVSDASRH